MKHFDKRLFWLFVPAVAFLYLVNDGLLIEFISVLSLGLLVAGLTHLIRKVLLPYIDMGDMAEQASLTPTGSGLIFLGASIMVAAFAIMTSLLMSTGH
ncbi:MAG: hypothetical protein M1572_01920 [Gammaproteobacteria bacterium]|nr:hypothetical protein [Gammaproteobacteria bacterium]HQT03429.1 hypothetical protein [Thiotrichales bacterium]